MANVNKVPANSNAPGSATQVPSGTGATQTGSLPATGPSGNTNTIGPIPTTQTGQLTATTQTGQLTVSPSPAQTTAAVPFMVVLQAVAPASGAPTTATGVQTIAQNNSTLVRKRQSTLSAVDFGYIASAGLTDFCAAAIMFQFNNGQLIDINTGVAVSANADLSPITFNNPVTAPITTGFSLSGNLLVWADARFFNGAAVFCLLNEVLYAIFTANGPPAGCTVVNLQVIQGLSSPFLQGSEVMLTDCSERLPECGAKRFRVWRCKRFYFWRRECFNFWRCERFRVWRREPIYFWRRERFRIWGCERFRVWSGEPIYLWRRYCDSIWSE